MWAFLIFSKVANVAAKQRKRDLIMIGFNGTSRAATSDATATRYCKMGKGWLQKMQEDAKERVMNGGKAQTTVLVGK